MIGINVTTAQLEITNDSIPVSCTSILLGMDMKSPTTEKTINGTQIKWMALLVLFWWLTA